MDTAIGVFASRDKAEEAVKKLLENEVPKESITFLTRSESEAKSIGKELGAYAGGFVGGAAGLSAGVAAATLLAIPGVGQVFALGFGAAALLGLVGAGTGSAVGAKAAAGDSDAPKPTADKDAAHDSLFFRQVLEQGHSLIVVRTESAQVSSTACRILDSLGISMRKGLTQKTRVTTRALGEAIAVDVVGRIALADGTAMVRDTVRGLMDQGQKRIVLNLSGVDFVDSSGLGELVRTHTSLRNHGGRLKIANPSKNLADLLRMTKLDKVLEIEPDEASALNSLGTADSASA